MLTSVPHPYPVGEAQRWIEGHEAGRAAGRDFPFAIENGRRVRQGAPRSTAKPMGAFIWLLGGQALLGHGRRDRGARAVAAFAFDELGVPEVKSGHFTDNHASGRVMTKLGLPLCEGELPLFGGGAAWRRASSRRC